jgi:hypothetical protein
MLEIGSDAYFLEEPIGAECRGKLCPKNLESYLALMAEVLREIDRGHATAPELALDRVAIAKRVG